MSVRIAIDGTFEEKDGRLKFKGKDTGGELPRIMSLKMGLGFKAGVSTCAVGALVVRVTRDASHGIKEELLASRYQFGEGRRGEEWVFPAEVWLVDDQRPGLAGVLGKFELLQAQIIRVQQEDDDGPPKENVVLHGYVWRYVSVAGQPQPMTADPRINPTKACGVH